MPIYPIRTFGDPVLNTPAIAVDEITGSIERLIDDMLETMYEAPGVGLAAPQIGISKRIFVADVGDGPFVMINPEVIEVDDLWEWEEGCLSLPGRFWTVERPGFARLTGIGLDGNSVTLEGDDLLGRVLQHEIDHLDGMLVLDRLPRRIRRQALRDLRNESLGIPSPR